MRLEDARPGMRVRVARLILSTGMVTSSSITTPLEVVAVEPQLEWPVTVRSLEDLQWTGAYSAEELEPLDEAADERRETGSHNEPPWPAGGEPMPSDPPDDWRWVPPASCPFCGADGEPSSVLGPGHFRCASCGTEMREVVVSESSL